MTAPRWTLLLALCCSSLGCTRAFYREQADGSVYSLIEKGIRDPRWALNRINIEPRADARFYDPFCPDHSPIPEDDPVSHELMHCVDCKKGWPCWHRNGDRNFVENPAWRDSLVYDKEGNVVLDLTEAVETALVHSRDYQQNVEDLYLSALDVTFERFRFDTQFFGGNETFFTNQGRVRGGGRSRSRLNTDTNLSAERLFTGGGQAVVDVANSLVWQFSGDNTYTANTLLSGTLVQPLLRFGGRERVLERLTRSERSLLANIRSMQRYRQGFYVEIASGRDAGNGPSRSGGVFGGSGLEGFSGVGASGFGGLAGGGGGRGRAGAGAGQAGGYFGLLQSQRQLENLTANVRSLRRSLAELEALIPQKQTATERADAKLQADQVRQSLYLAEATLLTNTATLEALLDRFKLILGLPPDLPVLIQDNLLKQFELLDPEMAALQNDATPTVTRLRSVVDPANEQVEPLPGEVGPQDAAKEHLRQSLRMVDAALDVLNRAQALVPRNENPQQQLQQNQQAYETRLRDLRAAYQQLLVAVELADRLNAVIQLTERAKSQLAAVETFLDQLKEISPKRIATLQRLVEREEVKSGRVDRDPFDVDQFQERLQRWPAEFSVIAERLNAQSKQWRPLAEEIDRHTVEVSELFDTVTKFGAPLRPIVEKLTKQLGSADLRDFAGQLDRLVADPDKVLATSIPKAQDLSMTLEAIRSRIVQEHSLELEQLAADAGAIGILQARVRLEAIVLVPIDLSAPDALEVARENRLDWMNARAGLVDSWRLIEFNANALETNLDVILSGDINTLDDNPFRFRSTTGQLRAGLRIDAPITRLDERNRYRQSLIEYQQSRRSYMNFVDGINQGLRNTLRTVGLNQMNFELNRFSVHVAIDQVELAALKLQKPPPPGVATTLGATTARDLVSALGDLLTAQNNYLSIWINYELQRMNLDLDLGTLQLDERGIWIDPGSIQGDTYRGRRSTWCEEDDAPLPPGVLPEPNFDNAPEDLQAPPPTERRSQVQHRMVSGSSQHTSPARKLGKH